MQVSGNVNMERNTAVEKYDNMKKYFERKEVIEHLNKVIPKVADGWRLLSIALGVVRMNPDLLKCSQASILAGIMQSLQMGLSLDPALKQAHLVPFWNDRKKQFEATFIPGYQGLLDLARRAGGVSSVSAHCVYASDHFILVYGTAKKLEHIPNDDRPENDTIRGAYIVYYFKDGKAEFDYMPWVDIQKRMAVSKAKQSGPWKEWVEEMAVKTVIRHSIKQVGISSDLARAAALEERALIGESQEDLMALPFEMQPAVEELPPPQSDEDQMKEYEEMVKMNIPSSDLLTWNKWVEETASRNNKPLPETILRIKNDFANALKVYGSWKASLPVEKPQSQPQIPSQAPVQPSVPEPLPKQGGKKSDPKPKTANPSTLHTPPPQPEPTEVVVICPNTGETKNVAEFCKAKCPYSEGCPVL